jgi:hypothetical protein
MTKTHQTIVNAWNEWDARKHIILGMPDGTMIAEPEPRVMYDFPDVGRGLLPQSSRRIFD